jgi:hypothetical protein
MEVTSIKKDCPAANAATSFHSRKLFQPLQPAATILILHYAIGQELQANM